jgi:hypothetical protein
MHRHRSVPWPDGVAPYDTARHEHQRRVILELAVTPPVAGDHLDDLARTLAIARPALDHAAAGLIVAGLAERRGERLFPTLPTRALDTLWPLG